MAKTAKVETVDYVTVKIPEPLTRVIDDYIAKAGAPFAYRSRTEFIVEATRKYLQQLQVL